MSAEIQKTNGVAKLEWTPERVKLIQDTVAKGSSQDEFKLLLYIARKYELDPLLKQIWCVKYSNNPAAIYTSRDGFLSIAHRSGKFNGMNTVPNFDANSKLVSATCTVFRKDFDHTIEVTVYNSEYNSGFSNWKKMPITMLCKVAESQALRKAFDISGIYGEDEQGAIEKTEDVKGIEVLSDELKKQIAGAKTDTEVKSIWAANKGLQKKTFFSVEITAKLNEFKPKKEDIKPQETKVEDVKTADETHVETPIEEAIPQEPEDGLSLEISAMIDEATELSQLTEIYKANQDIKGNAHFLGVLNKKKIALGKKLGA